jgi:hypothetical protein
MGASWAGRVSRPARAALRQANRCCGGCRAARHRRPAPNPNADIDTATSLRSVKFGHVALDGTKVQANASMHKAALLETEKRLTAEVSAWFARAEATPIGAATRWRIGRR